MFRLLLAGLLLNPAAAFSAPRPTVIELFTSESCSSCPPADALLDELARSRPDVLPLGFHVDYWNALSWRDRFSSPAATARQRQYAAWLGTEVYTPQLVVDGHWQVVGSDRAAVMAAIAQAQAAQEAGPNATISAADSTVTVHVGLGKGRGTVLLVSYDNLHTTNVGSGENAGRAVPDANTVRSIAEIGAWTGAAAAYTASRNPGDHLAVLVQDDEGNILAAAKN